MLFGPEVDSVAGSRPLHEPQLNYSSIRARAKVDSQVVHSTKRIYKSDVCKTDVQVGHKISHTKFATRVSLLLLVVINSLESRAFQVETKCKFDDDDDDDYTK